MEKSNEFYDSLLSKSLFGEKNIIIKRATDKIIKLLIEIIDRNLEDILIIVEANVLEKSKLRTLFEKDKNVCVLHFMKIMSKHYLNLQLIFFQKRRFLFLQQI